MTNIFTILNKLFLGMGFSAPRSGNRASRLLRALNRIHLSNFSEGAVI